MDEATVLRIRRLLRDKQAAADREAELPITCRLLDETGFPHRGKLSFIDTTRPDPWKRIVHAEVLFPNADEVLMPGQFVTMRLTLSVPHDATLVPPAAVTAGYGGYSTSFVKVVNAKNVAELRRAAKIEVLLPNPPPAPVVVTPPAPAPGK